jgi:hypothetical protein
MFDKYSHENFLAFLFISKRQLFLVFVIILDVILLLFYITILFDFFTNYLNKVLITKILDFDDMHFFKM